MFLEREPLSGSTDHGSYVYAGVRCRPQPPPASYLIRAIPNGPVHPAEPGTLEHFLVERYLLYAESQNLLYLGQVYHHTYPLQTARLLSIDENLIKASGLPQPEGEPLAHFASGVNVKVYGLQNVTR